MQFTPKTAAVFLEPLLFLWYNRLYEMQTERRLKLWK